ncbi:MAG: GWxTD domain-containing protein [Longimicrobiales bacterium]
MSRPRLVLPAVTALAMVACGPSGPGRPTPESGGPIGRPLETYQQLGLLAGPGHFPAVASFSTMGGPHDSPYVLLGVSMPNSALRFQRDGEGFAAEYRVVATFLQDSQVVKRLEKSELVRVATFAETGRTDESVVFQDAITLPAGYYEVALQAADANSSRGFRVRDTLHVPTYGRDAKHLPQPIVVYHGLGRTNLERPPDLILNPRHTVAYGGDAPRVYLEVYGADEPRPVVVKVVDEAGTEVWSARTSIADGDAAVRHALIDLPAATLPLGKLWVEIVPEQNSSDPSVRAPLVISISDQWMVANFEEVLDFIEYIATREELDSLRAGSPADRRSRWDRFWAKRDPLPATPINEFRDEFFQRVRFATEQFSEPGGLPGWRTDRGEVFIVLGAPEFAQDRFIGRTDMTGRPNAIEWTYDGLPGGRLTLLFLDRTGFGRFELAPASEAAFRSVAERRKPRPQS